MKEGRTTMHTKTLILMILILHLTACTAAEQVASQPPTEQPTSIPDVTIPAPTASSLPTATSTPAPTPTVFSTPNPNEIIEQLVAAERLATYTLTEMHIQTSLEGVESESLVILTEQWTDGARKRRSVFYEEDDDGQKVSMIDVTNGNQIWHYEAYNNSYTELPLLDVTHLNVPFSPNPNIAEQMFQQLGEQTWHLFEFTYLGGDEIAGRESHKFQLTPQGQAQLIFSMYGGEVEYTMWVDVEMGAMLKYEMVSEIVQTSITVLEIEYDPDFSEDIFTFVPPEGAVKKEILSE